MLVASTSVSDSGRTDFHFAASGWFKRPVTALSLRSLLTLASRRRIHMRCSERRGCAPSDGYGWRNNGGGDRRSSLAFPQ